MKGEALLRPKQVAQQLQGGLSSIYRLHAKGILPGIKVPGVGLRFRPEAIEQFLRQLENGRGRRWRRRPPSDQGGTPRPEEAQR